ncbi:MAG: PEP-CTERM sorting domain-containing protein [Opitutales bacterium]|nr:PEP-CTERM sorting domain-containing protein [Opitutales bacterium]
MKKCISIIGGTLAIGAMCSNAAEVLDYSSGNTGADLLSGLSEEVCTALKTEGSVDYSLNFKAPASAVHFAVNDNLYFYQIYSDGSIGSYTIDFGENGSITAHTDYNQWGGAIRFTQGATVTFNVAVSAEQLNTSGLFTRALVSTPETSANGVNGTWNITDNLTFNANGLDGYKYKGKIDDASTLAKGEYGYIVSNGDTISLAVATIPEPSAFGLLAGLGVLALVTTRRRRK